MKLLDYIIKILVKPVPAIELKKVNTIGHYIIQIDWPHQEDYVRYIFTEKELEKASERYNEIMEQINKKETK